MQTRTDELQSFLDALEAAIKSAVPDDAPAAKAARRAFDALATPAAGVSQGRAEAPVCQHLPSALSAAAAGPAAPLAAAFAAIEPSLAWRPRPDRKSPDPKFADAHANAAIIGDGGLEARDDVRIGVSLLAPNTHYPDHRHPPEEVYIVLSDGAWRQNDGPWRAPGPGGYVYNPPNIVHSMHSAETPLLAIWTLPIDRT